MKLIVFFNRLRDEPHLRVDAGFVSEHATSSQTLNLIFRSEAASIAHDPDAIISLEVITMAMSVQGRPAAVEKLEAVLTALWPFFLDYRAARIEIEQVGKSAGDFAATSDLRYKTSWLKNRVLQASRLGNTPDQLQDFKPLSHKTFEAEIQENGLRLQLFSEADRTPTRCEMAVRSDARALEYVPGHLRTRALCDLVLFGSPKGACMLRHIPISLRDKATCELAILTNGLNLEFVPESQLTAELCALACCRHELAAALVPPGLDTPEVLYCQALHGTRGETPAQIFDALYQVDPARAGAMVDKYDELFQKIHYPAETAAALDEYNRM